MTDEEAAAIKARWNWNLVDALPTGSQAKADVRALLTERAALLEIVCPIASYGVVESTFGGALGTARVTRQVCEWCMQQAPLGEPFTHRPDCLAHQARVLLGIDLH